MLQGDVAAKKNTYWIGMLVYNSFVCLEALLLSIMIFYANCFQDVVGILSVFYVGAYWAQGVIGFLMKSKPKFVSVYLGLNLTCRILHFWFMTGFLFAWVLVTMWGFLGRYFLVNLFRIYILYNQVFYAWYVINFFLMIGGTVLIVTFRNLVRQEDLYSHQVLNIDNTPLINPQGSVVVTQPQYYQPGPGQYTYQPYNPNVQQPQYTNVLQYQQQPQNNPNPQQPQYQNVQVQPLNNPNPQSQPINNPPPQKQMVNPIPPHQETATANMKVDDVNIQVTVPVVKEFHHSEIDPEDFPKKNQSDNFNLLKEEHEP